MVGFNPNEGGGYSDTVDIYIPLWSDSIQEPTMLTRGSGWYLHSIMVGFNPSVVVVDTYPGYIYIPLWSDSIHTLYKAQDESIIFTFHYGRIQSLLHRTFRCCHRTFTFHYGRIQSEARVIAWFASEQIYIPLWSDSIGCSSTDTSGVTTFTFHYGRIQSRLVQYR